MACALPLLVTRLTVGNQHDRTQDRIPQFQTSAELDPQLSLTYHITQQAFFYKTFKFLFSYYGRERERA